jgi:hypothetical protein
MWRDEFAVFRQLYICNSIGDAENLCVGKIETLRRADVALPFDLDEGSQPSIERRPRARQLAFRFEGKRVM